MPAKVISLHNISNELCYPETIATAVHMPDGKRDLIDELEEIKDGSCTIEFNNDGSITQTMTNSGMYIVTEFGAVDGVITETAYYSDATLYYTETTTFNSDGTITVDKVYEDNSGGD